MRTFYVLPLFAFGLAAGEFWNGWQPPADPRFDVAVIKPAAEGTRAAMTIDPGGRLSANGFPLKFFISSADHIPVFQIAGADGWMTNDRWLIEAKAEGLTNVPAFEPPYLPEIMAVRLRALLQDRFALKSHREKRELKAYVLTVSKKGSKLAPGDPAARGAMAAGPGVIQAYAATMDQFVVYLNRIMDLPVIDRTGLDRTGLDQTGLGEKYRFTLKFAAESVRPLAAPERPRDPAPESAGGAAAESSGATIFDAIRDQLGLDLKEAKEPVEVLVVDSAQKPTAN